MIRLVFNYSFMKEEYLLDEDKDTFIGRDRGNNLTIPDYKIFSSLPETIQKSFYSNLVKISRRHAKISVNMGKFFITDIGTANMGSTHGTFINGDKIEPRKPHQINDMDKISFGPIYCIFKLI